LVDCSVRLQQLEAMATDGADIVQRLDAFNIRLTALEKRQRRPPPFPITVISNETRKPEPAEVRPLVEQAWRRQIAEGSERAVERRLKNNEISPSTDASPVTNRRSPKCATLSNRCGRALQRSRRRQRRPTPPIHQEDDTCARSVPH
jgi:hypothetical protein